MIGFFGFLQFKIKTIECALRSGLENPYNQNTEETLKKHQTLPR